VFERKKKMNNEFQQQQHIQWLQWQQQMSQLTPQQQMLMHQQQQQQQQMLYFQQQVYLQQQQQQQQRQHPVVLPPLPVLPRAVARQPQQSAGVNAAVRCEPCQKTFSNATALRAHEAQHRRCTEPNCEFSAASSALQLHVLREHDELYKRLVPRSIETEEEIAAWREARKRNFPTKDKRVAFAAAAPPPRQKAPRVCNSFVRTGSCRFGEQCTFVHDEQRRDNHRALAKARRVGVAKKPLADAATADEGTKVSLLKKLLAKDIAASNEPAVLAQCIAYIVANDFFDSVPLVLAVDGADDDRDDDSSSSSSSSSSSDDDSSDKDSSSDDDSSSDEDRSDADRGNEENINASEDK
jgi:hypothetical protein